MQGLGDVLGETAETDLAITIPKVDTTALGEAIMRLQEFNLAANELITNSITNTFGQLGSAIGEALATGGNVLKSIGVTILQGMGKFLSDMGGMLIKYGTLAILKGKLDIAILTGGPVAIGAGIAAVAVGIALKAAGAAIGSAATSGGGSSRSSSRASEGGSSSSSSNGRSRASSGFSSGGDLQNVVFELQGTKLIGVISNTLRQNRSLGGGLGLAG